MIILLHWNMCLSICHSILFIDHFRVDRGVHLKQQGKVAHLHKLILAAKVSLEFSRGLTFFWKSLYALFIEAELVLESHVVCNRRRFIRIYQFLSIVNVNVKFKFKSFFPSNIVQDYWLIGDNVSSLSVYQACVRLARGLSLYSG